MKNMSLKQMTAIASFGAIGGLLYAYLKFSVPFLPAFLEINFSDVPALISGFAYGPFVGAMVQVVKVLVKLLLTGSSTAYVGELSDLVLGITIVLPAAFIYKYHRTIKGAITGLIASFVTHIVLAIFINHFILIPFYIKFFFDGNEQVLLAVCQAAVPSIDSVGWPLILMGVLPFNLLKNVIVMVIVFFVYKPLFKVINATARKMQKSKNKS